MPEKMTSKDKNRAAILKAALPHVAFDGWTPAVMRQAAQEAGIGHEAMRVAFPGGVNDLIDYFLADGDRRMAETLAGRGLDNMKIREKVTLAVRSRIEADADHREALRRAVSYAALPVAGALGPRSLYRTVDAIWRAVGDTSADFNFYTKRAILAAVYSAVTLHWLGDETEDFSSTWAFLDRRIEDVMRIEKAKAGLRGFAEKLPDPVGLMGRLRYPGTRG
ncbi:COQ9 family protein [Parvibaculum sp. MBR-TMA-1.3b-4.2]|jgi:ubiquinone biosynthesis protein COQ9